MRRKKAINFTPKKPIDLLGQLCVLQAWELDENPTQFAPPY